MRSPAPLRTAVRTVLRTAVRAVVVLAVLFGWSAAAGSAVAADAVARARGQAAVEVRGGDTLYSAGARCTVGFNARSGSTTYALVAGRCAQGSSVWYADAALTVEAGVTAAVSFPGNDYASIRYTNTAIVHPGEVSLGAGGGTRDITGAAHPVVGQSVCHVGRTSGYRCGTVQAVNVTVNYGGGAVSGLFRSSACSEPGDAGGPAFSGGTALGIIVGSSGNCGAGGVTYYQPVTEWLSAYGLSLY
ncbi:S1 family peptidase [Streptomyces zingiberis]|uniref:Streptogrisin B n=1 Tax=Streptomyces zingiberis TaxID=2053010 RepID=A0ABX1BZJ5_9ACTN|nr:S1 family peptidase [Streptomyces zingiberis]NJQ02543.1 streptogrisin B precursor [Streptomyces zingiberis]